MRGAGWIIGCTGMLAAATWGCGGGVATPGAGGAGGSGGAPTTTTTTNTADGGASTGGTGGMTTVTTSSSSTTTTSSSSSTTTTQTFPDSVIAGASCASEPPPGAYTPPPPKPYSGGTCPTLVQGTNDIKSGGNDRKLILAIPANLQPDEKLPILFLWHWLGADANSFYTKGEVQAAVDQQRFIAVLPESKGDIFEWPFNVADTQARIDEEFAFFDDLLSCVSQQFNTNLSCVSSIGVSAGALFTDQLGSGRGDYLASIVSLSGGTGGFIRPWGHPAHRMPAMVLWGGSNDTCIVINFEQGSKDLEMALTQDGNFIVECLHNCGHTEPPFEAPPGMSKYAGMWKFALEHPYWLPPGKSPYTTNGLPAGMPEWCSVGVGTAVQRTGMCSGGGC